MVVRVQCGLVIAVIIIDIEAGFVVLEVTSVGKML